MAGSGTNAFVPNQASLDVARAFVLSDARPTVLVARAGTVLAVSPNVVSLFDEPVEALIGQDFTTLYTPTSRSALRDTLATAIATATPRRVAIEPDGYRPASLFDCACTPISAPDGYVLGLICSLTPLARMSRVDRAARTVEQERSINEFARTAIRSKSMQRLGLRAMSTLSDVCNADAVGSFRLTHDALILRRSPHAPECWKHAAAEPRGGNSLVAQSIRNGRSSISSDLQRDLEFDPSPWLDGFRSVIVTPIRAHGRIIGGLLLTAERPDAFDADDLAIVNEVAALLEAATERSTADRSPQPEPEQLSLALGQHAIGTWAWDPGTNRFWLSSESEAMLGLTSHDFGGTFEDFAAMLIDPTEPGDQQLRVRLNELARAGTTELRFLDPQGNRHWVELRGRLFDANDPEDAWVGVMLDVTERNRILAERIYLEEQANLAREAARLARGEAQLSDARMRQIFQDAPTGIGLWDAESRCIAINAMLADIFATSANLAVGKLFSEHSTTAWAALGAAFRSVLNTGTAVEHLDLAGFSPATLGHMWAFKVFPTRLHGTITGVGVVAIDTTEQHRAHQIEELLHRALEISTIPAASVRDRITALAELVVPDFADCVLIGHREPETDTPNVLAIGVELEGPSVAPALHGLQVEADRARFLSDDERANLATAIALKDGMVIDVGNDRTRVRVILGITQAERERYVARDLAIIGPVAHRMADSIEHVALRMTAELATDRLEVLARLGELTTSAITSTSGLSSVARACVPQFADAALLLLVDRATNSIHGTTATSSDPDVAAWFDSQQNTGIPLDADSPAANSIRSGQTIHFTRAEMAATPGRYSPILHEVASRLRMESGIMIPIISADGPVGALFCSRTAQRRQFGPEDLELAPEIARRVVPLLEVGQRLRRAQEHTEALQRSLLPLKLPYAFGYTLAAQYRAAESELRVGGDWYDVLELPDRSLLLAIGDVTGHGAFAAGLTGQLRTALRIAILDTADVSTLLTRLDQFLNGLPDFEMGTALLIHLHRDSGHFTWASAGHPAPLLRRTDGTTTFLAERVGPPLGAELRAVFPCYEARLKPDDCLLLYTDGLIERRNESIDTGSERLADFVRTNRPADTELDACAIGLMDAMTTDYAPEDDIALLIVHRSHGVTECEFSIAASPDGVRTARHRVADHLRKQGIDTAIVDDLILVTSELCANALEHSGSTESPILVHCATSPNAVELSVEDAGTWVTTGPRRGGRGLQIVRALTDAIEITRTAPGTRVTARRSRALQPA